MTLPMSFRPGGSRVSKTFRSSRCGSAVLPSRWRCERRTRGNCGHEMCNRSVQGEARALHGPFSFPKGPLYFVSRRLVEQLLCCEHERVRRSEGGDPLGDERPIPTNARGWALVDAREWRRKCVQEPRAVMRERTRHE